MSRIGRLLRILTAYKFSTGTDKISINSLNTVCTRGMTTKSQPTVYITGPVPEKAVELLSDECEVTQYNSNPIPREELLKNIHGKDALFCLLTDKIDKALLDAAGPSLKVIGTMSVGCDHIDLAECKRRNIPVGFTPDVLTDATAELTVALLLATSRRLFEGNHAVTSGQWGTWTPSWLCGPGLKNSTVGIVGLGRIGLAVGKCLKPFGVSRFFYTGHGPKESSSEIGAEFVSLDKLLTDSDFVIVTCALTSTTKEMFNIDAFKKMKKTAIFVNVSRGGTVKQDDLYKALKSGEIRAAGLDVTTPEPLPTDNPLLTLSNCVVIPHLGSATHETRSQMAELTARNILAGLKGQDMPAQMKI